MIAIFWRKRSAAKIVCSAQIVVILRLPRANNDAIFVPLDDQIWVTL
jgi:hypothetical protein